jgi:cytidylate kinase
MTGSGGHSVASSLAEYLQAHVPPHQPWTIFDQTLLEKALEDRHMQRRIIDFMEEGHKSMLRDSVEEWMGLHPSSWSVVQWINATILRMAQSGNVILVGRGATVIARKVNTAYHVRLVGSLEKRIARVEQIHGLDRKKAMALIKKKDEGRKRYFKDNFDADIDNPLLYHIIVNTDLTRYEEAAGLIGDAVIRRFNLVSGVRQLGSEKRAVS